MHQRKPCWPYIRSMIWRTSWLLIGIFIFMLRLDCAKLRKIRTYSAWKPLKSWSHICLQPLILDMSSQIRSCCDRRTAVVRSPIREE